LVSQRIEGETRVKGGHPWNVNFKEEIIDEPTVKGVDQQ